MEVNCEKGRRGGDFDVKIKEEKAQLDIAHSMYKKLRRSNL
jgi:hypothetical protein